MSTPVYPVAAIREIERAAQMAEPGVSLMARAGRAAAAHAQRMLGGAGRAVLVCAGPGNNGGDAFEVAVLLKRDGHRVTVVFTGDAARLTSDAAAALEKWRAEGGELAHSLPARARFDLVIDGLYGIGLSRALTGADLDLVERINQLGAPTLALDIPSGLAGDSGEVLGLAVRATETITFIARKPGLLTLDGPDQCGTLHCDPLGLVVGRLLATPGWYVAPPDPADWPAPRPRNFHKGLAGSVGIIGGAAGMAGAAILAGRAALRLGAGKVFVGFAGTDPPPLDPLQPELMLRAADTLLESTHLDSLAIGPGLGTGELAQALLDQALEADAPLVIDADALNLLAAAPARQAAVARRSAPTIITPHPAEAARLLGASTRAVQSDRLRAAREIARRLNALTVLKGNGSITAAPTGTFWINGSGNPGMASGGMGDVLTGLIASLVAQGLDAATATRFGVWLHGAAADRAVAAGIGPAGLTASELIDAARQLINTAPTGAGSPPA